MNNDDVLRSNEQYLKKQVRENGRDLKAKEDAEEAAKKNFHFLQVEKKTLKELRRLSVESPKALQILFLLAEKMNRENAVVISNKTVIELTGISQPSVTRAIKTLKDERWVQIIKIGTTNAYLVNNTAFWQNTGDKKHTTFRAAIVATSTEQDEPVEKMQQAKLRHLPFVEIKEAQQVRARISVTNEQLDPPDQSEMDV